MKDICDICTTTDSIITPKAPKGRLLYCTCPFCQKKVAADIYNGIITCPSCNKQVEWQE